MDLRLPIYNGVASRAISYNTLITQMSQVKWDLKEITSEQSPYVEFILTQFRSLKDRLAWVLLSFCFSEISSDQYG